MPTCHIKQYCTFLSLSLSLSLSPPSFPRRSVPLLDGRSGRGEDSLTPSTPLEVPVFLEQDLLYPSCYYTSATRPTDQNLIPGTHLVHHPQTNTPGPVTRHMVHHHQTNSLGPASKQLEHNQTFCSELSVLLQRCCPQCVRTNELN